MLKGVFSVLGIVALLGVVSAATAQYGGGGGSGDPLVADTAGAAARVDPNLVNAWGLVAGPSTPWWVNNNHTNTSLMAGCAQVSTGAVLKREDL